MPLVGFGDAVRCAGATVGIGTTLLPHCDFVYSAPGAYFWTPFTRIAVVPEFCSSRLFPEIMGVSLASEMLLMGRRMDSGTALQCGLVSAVFEPQELLPTVRQRLHTMLGYTHGAKSVRLFKSMVKRNRRAELDAVLKAELAELDVRLENGDTAEAALATIMAMAEAKKRTARSLGGGGVATNSTCAPADGCSKL